MLRFGPRAIGLAMGFILLAGVYLFWGWSRVLGDFGGDNAHYLFMAHSYSPWSTASEVAVFFSAHNLYPPLYPLVLAVFGGGESLLAAHIVTIVLLLLAFITFYQWLRILGVSRTGAGLLTLLFSLLPGTYIHALSILSENLFLLLALACLAAVSRFETDRYPPWLWVASISLAGAMLTRSAGIALLAAFILYLVVHRPVRYWFLVGSAPLVPMVLWHLLSHKEGPGYLETLLAKYGSDPFSALSDHLKAEIVLIAQAWVGNFSSSPIGLPVMVFVGLLSLIGMAQRLHQRKLDGYYAAAYLLLIMAWPYPAESQRFILVIIPVLLAQAWLLVGRLPGLRLGESILKPAYMILLMIALVATPNLLLTIQRFNQELPPALTEFKRSSRWYVINPAEARMNLAYDNLLVEHLGKIRDVVPQEGCLYGIKPSIIGYYAGRISIAPPKPEVDEMSFSSSLKNGRCRFFYLMNYVSPSYPVAYYPLNRLERSLTILNAAPSAIPGGGPVALLTEWRQP